jgi:hypothetical protein
VARKNLNDARQALLDEAARAQIVYWDALRKLESAIGVDLDDVGELIGLTVQDVIKLTAI